MAPMAI